MSVLLADAKVGEVTCPPIYLMNMFVLDYPCPLWSVRDRQPLYGEIGHTIMDLLAVSRFIWKTNIMCSNLLLVSLL